MVYQNVRRSNHFLPEIFMHSYCFQVVKTLKIESFEIKLISQKSSNFISKVYFNLHVFKRIFSIRLT